MLVTSKLLLSDIKKVASYLSKQCAALTSQRSLMIVAPHVWRPWNLRLTCHGSSPSRASSPPTTRVPIAGRVPQAEGGKMDDVRWGFVTVTTQLIPVSASALCCSVWQPGVLLRRIKWKAVNLKFKSFTTTSFIRSVCTVGDEVTLWVHFGDTFSVIAREGVVRTPGWRQHMIEEMAKWELQKRGNSR